MKEKLAVIDLGTNTFQMMIAEELEGGFQTVSQTSIPSRLGKGGINHGFITDEAIQRALSVLGEFRKLLVSQDVKPERTFIYGTSAVRNAVNRTELLEKIQEQMNAPVHVIDGSQEAQLIYYGVKQAVEIDETPNLIMDIGGGSVEFIIADRHKVFWKNSFEVGGQRLLERFVKTDPISTSAIRQIHHFLEQTLIPLMNAIHQYAPQTLVGSSGTFETLAEIEHWRQYQCWPPTTQLAFEISMDSFYQSRNLILSSNREERMRIPGMKELRVDMIGSALCLIDFIVQSTGIKSLKASRYSLKEGAAFLLVQNKFVFDL